MENPMISLTQVRDQKGQEWLARRSAVEASMAPHLSDADALAVELHRRIKGEVRFDTGSRALYATDASNYRQVPLGVVIPRDEEDVIETVAVCRRFGSPIVGRGGGTSLCGQCCNVAIVLDFSKYMHRILE
jgi:FAD/FMN-containing dehydrogenase